MLLMIEIYTNLYELNEKYKGYRCYRPSIPCKRIIAILHDYVIKNKVSENSLFQDYQIEKQDVDTYLIKKGVFYSNNQEIATFLITISKEEILNLPTLLMLNENFFDNDFALVDYRNKR